MKSIKIISTAVIGSCLSVGVGCANEKNKQETSSKPNIIFILTDDLGWGDLGCYGNGDIKTPNLDKMAKKGTLFANYYANSPVCSPSRTALMTGQYPARFKIHTALNKDHEANEESGQCDFLDPKVITITQLFKNNGYATGHFGKWHLGGTPDAPKPSAYGIDESITANSIENNLNCPRSESSQKIIDATIKFIEKNKDKPFYVNVWSLVPHALLAPTTEQMEVYKDFGPQGEAKMKGFSTPAQIYYSSVTDLDNQIGRLLNKVEELGLSENTIIVFTSDNGPEDIHIPNSAHSGIGSPGPFRGRKRSLYDGGVRVPFIVQWKGHIPEGKVDSKSIVGGVDLLPTFCNLAGIKLPSGYESDGENVSPNFKGDEYVRSKPLMWDWRFSQTGYTLNKSPQLALRIDQWKFLMNPDGSRIELYDFNVDLQGLEVDNVADKHSELVEQFKKKLLDFEHSLPQGKRILTGGQNTYPMPK